MIETLENVMSFCGVENEYWTVNAGNDVLMLTYDTGVSTAVDIPDGTYNGTTLAAAIQTAMNSTLTMSGTVTWSSTTRKFTFTAGGAHTLTYTHTGSDAGLLVGFNQAHSAATSLVSDIECGDPTEIITNLHTEVEKWISTFCNRTFESTSYTERYDGDDSDTLFLKQYPVTDVSRVSYGKLNIIAVHNTNEYTTATVSVNSTGIVLTKDGTSDSTVTFAAYTTLSAVVAAINLISGWSATLQDSTYSNYKSTELRDVYGLNCIDDEDAYLYIPNTPMASFVPYFNEGYLYNENCWPKGNRNIYVDYTAGYSSANMPPDVKMAVKLIVKHIYQRHQEESLGANSYSLGGISVSFDPEGIPVQALRTLKSYRKVNV